MNAVSAAPQDTAAAPQDVAIVGGGMSGMLAALMLARDGHRVTVYERDDTPLPATADEAFEQWNRSGAPHARQSHALLARLRTILRDRLPDVLDALYAQGATELRLDELMPPTIEDRTPMPGDEEVALLCCRRLTIEWVLRKACESEPGVTWRGGVAVAGLVSDGTDVRGIRLDDGTVIDADLVVAGSGRSATIMDWIAALDLPAAPTEEMHESGIIYLSRFYRLREGKTLPLLSKEGGAGGDLGYMAFAGFYGDNRTFSITFGIPTDDAALRRLNDNDVWERVIRTLTPLAPWTSEGLADPISDVEVMARLRNRIRHFVVDGKPVAPGLVVIGDAVVGTNPWYGKGCALAGIGALALSNAIKQHGTDRVAIALAMDEAVTTEMKPHYDQACRQDADRIKVRAATYHGAEPDPMAMGVRDFVLHGLIPATRVDPVAYRAFFRAFNMLDHPDALMKNAAVMAAAQKAFAEKDQRPPLPKLGPDRDELLALLSNV